MMKLQLIRITAELVYIGR